MKMCEYSLESVRSRKAKVGERLVLRPLGRYGTMGFTSPGDPETAVCLIPGTKVIMSEVPEPVQRESGAPARAGIATFGKFQRNPRTAYAYCDGFRFEYHRRLWLVQEFPDGTEITVEEIPSENDLEDEARTRHELVCTD